MEGALVPQCDFERIVWNFPAVSYNSISGENRTVLWIEQGTIKYTTVFLDLHVILQKHNSIDCCVKVEEISCGKIQRQNGKEH